MVRAEGHLVWVGEMRNVIALAIRKPRDEKCLKDCPSPFIFTGIRGIREMTKWKNDLFDKLNIRKFLVRNVNNYDKNRNHHLDSPGSWNKLKMCRHNAHNASPPASLGWCLPKEIFRLRNVAGIPRKLAAAQCPMFVIGWIVFVKSIFVLEMKVPLVAVIAHITGPVRLFLWIFSLTRHRHQFVCQPLSNILYIFLKTSLCQYEQNFHIESKRLIKSTLIWWHWLKGVSEKSQLNDSGCVFAMLQFCCHLTSAQLTAVQCSPWSSSGVRAGKIDIRPGHQSHEAFFISPRPGIYCFTSPGLGGRLCPDPIITSVMNRVMNELNKIEHEAFDYRV